MSDLSQIVKAYDVRGTVPDQFDEAVAEALGAAFVQMLRRPASRGDAVVVAHDMRAVLARAGRRVRRRRTRPRGRVIDIGLGLHRPALLRLRRARPARARCSPPATTRRSTTASRCAAPAPAPIGQDSGLAEIRERAPGPARRPDRPAGAPAAPVERRDLLADYAAHLRAAGRPLAASGR